MSISVMASAETLMRQAGFTAEEYMHKAVGSIDGKLGDGYAKKNPELIAAFMKTAAMDYEASCLLKGLESIAEEISELSTDCN